MTGQTCSGAGGTCGCAAGDKVCAASNSCIPNGTCCTTADCSVTGQSCSGSGGSCVCASGSHVCPLGNNCIPNGACCSSADCSVTGQTCSGIGGSCNCAANKHACNASNSCITNGTCCTTADCTVGGQSCNGAGGSCLCAAGQKLCVAQNQCIANAWCCSNTDCPAQSQTNGTSCTTATGACNVTGCNNGFANPDGSYANGCECADAGFGKTCGTSTLLNTLGIGGTITRNGNLPAVGAENWFTVTFAYTTATSYHPHIVLTSPSGTTMKMDIGKTCTAAACGLTGGTGVTDWEVFGGGAATGLTYAPTPSVGTMIIRVYQTAGARVCANYALTITN